MAKRINQEGSYGKQNINGIDYFYYVFPTNAVGKRKKIYARTQKELTEKINKYKEEKRLTSDITIYTTVTNLCYDFLQHGCFVSKNTLNHYYGIVKNRISEWKKYDIGNVVASSLTPKMVTEYLFSLTNTYSQRSIERTYAVLEQALKYGIEEHIISENFQFSKVKKPQEKDVVTKRKENIILEKEDITAIANECLRKTADGVYFYGTSAKVIYMLIFTGCRVTEMCSLKWENVANDYSYIDIAGQHLRVTDQDAKGNKIGESYFIDTDPKTETSKRRIPLPLKAQELLKQQKLIATGEARKESSKRAYGASPDKTIDDIQKEFVFLSRTRTFIERSAIEKTCRIICRNCGVNNGVTPHTLRHAYGSLLISNGVDIKIVSKLLGHTSVAFTYDTYINVLKSAELNAVKILDDIIKEKEIDSILDGNLPLECMSSDKMIELYVNGKKVEIKDNHLHRMKMLSELFEQTNSEEKED